MSKSTRLSIIKRIQQKRNSFMISYITSTRPQLEVMMSMDAIRKIYEHLYLKSASDSDERRIDLFIHSNGGEATVPWRLVTLIREYSDHFGVIVPYKAFSAATLTAMGADEIVMHPMGMLGPTDPTVTNRFNPKDSASGELLGISVEDVTAFIALIKEDAGIRHEDELVTAFNKLDEQVHPLALGNVKRFVSQSRMMARKLLSLHMDKAKDDHKIKEIVENLTSKLYYHGHPINRVEASIEVGLPNVVVPKRDLEKLIWNLYLEYEREIKMEESFAPGSEFLTIFPTLAVNDSAVSPLQTAKLAFIESLVRTDVFLWEYLLSGTKMANGGVQVSTIVNKQGWLTE